MWARFALLTLQHTVPIGGLLVIKSCLFGLACLSLAACERHTSESPEPYSSAPQSSQPVAEASQLPLNKSGDSTWALNSDVDKMTGSKKNRVTKLFAAEQHDYAINFSCDASALNISIEAYTKDSKGAAIPWILREQPFMNRLVAIRDVRVRYGDEMTVVTLHKGDYGNTGWIDLWSMGEGVTSGRRGEFNVLKSLLKASVLNLADVFPEEVVELDPPAGATAIDAFLRECDQRIPVASAAKKSEEINQPVAAPGAAAIENLSSTTQSPVLADQKSELTADRPSAIATSPTATEATNSSVRTEGPSFDCSKASTVQEKLICSNAELAAADRVLADAYSHASNVVADKIVLRNEQKRWLTETRNTCTSVQCMLPAYRDRTAKLLELAARSGVQTDRP